MYLWMFSRISKKTCTPLFNQHIAKYFFGLLLITFLPNHLLADSLPPVYDMDSTTPKTWQEIDLVYYNDFSYLPSLDHKSIDGCKVHLDKNNNKILRCAEHIHLLRPENIVDQYKNAEAANGYFPLTIEQFNINNVQAHLLNIKKTTLNFFKLNSKNPKEKPVIGRYERHFTNLRTYTFIDSQGKEEIVHVTPDHKFYVVDATILDKQGYQSHFFKASEIGKDDHLLTKTGQTVGLVCLNNKKIACGEPYGKSGWPLSMYELEIYQQPNYIIGDNIKLISEQPQLHLTVRKKT